MISQIKAPALIDTHSQTPMAADISTLKYIYLLQAQQAVGRDNTAAQITWLTEQLLTGPGKAFVEGGWEVRSGGFEGANHSAVQHATDEDRSAALKAVIQDLTGASSVNFAPNFNRFRP